MAGLGGCRKFSYLQSCPIWQKFVMGMVRNNLTLLHLRLEFLYRISLRAGCAEDHRKKKTYPSSHRRSCPAPRSTAPLLAASICAFYVTGSMTRCSCAGTQACVARTVVAAGHRVAAAVWVALHQLRRVTPALAAEVTHVISAADVPGKLVHLQRRHVRWSTASHCAVQVT